MNNISLTILILTLVSCSKNKQTNQSLITESVPEIQNVRVDTFMSSARIYFDSSHYSISRIKHTNGKPYSESITDRKIKIVYEKEYYLNGLLKKQGMMTYHKSYHIGKWEYYSEIGKLDSIIDFNTKQLISYFEAIRIGEENGFTMPDIEVRKKHKGSKWYWELVKSSEMKEGGRQSAETILIDNKTGEVSIPEYLNF